MSTDVRELRREARGLLPPEVYDFIAGGSGQERTLRANARAWRQVSLAPRVLRDVSRVDTRVMINGGWLATPIAVAATAFHHLVHPDAELASAAGAARAGALYVLSTRSSRRIEDVASVLTPAGASWWFQAYVMRDRQLTAGLVRRAAATGAAAVVLTADTPVLAHRRRDRGADLISEGDFLVNLGPLDDISAAEQAADVTRADITWLAEISGGLPVIVKGVLRPDDALACARHGAAGVIVSNHGGRQLDGAIPTARALPGIVAALSPVDGCEVYVDGGLRTGEDVLAALALGARAAFIGRPVLWALACGGADGVAGLLTSLTGGLSHAMALAGAARVPDLAGTAWPPDRAAWTSRPGGHTVEV